MWFGCDGGGWWEGNKKVMLVRVWFGSWRGGCEVWFFEEEICGVCVFFGGGFYWLMMMW